MKHALLLFALLSIVSCGGTKEKEKKKENVDEVLIGDYVYLDTDGILHVKENCVMGLQEKNELGIESWKGVHRIDATSLSKSDLMSIPTCSWCVKDDHYEQLKALNGYYN